MREFSAKEDDAETQPSTSQQIRFYISTMAIPMVCIPGIVFTAAAAVVFARKIVARKRRLNNQTAISLDMLLLALSVYDCALLVASTVLFPSMTICDSAFSERYSTCQLANRVLPFVYPILLMSQFGSVWMCVAVAVDRFVVVTFPLKRLQWGGVSYAGKMIIGVFVFDVIFRSPVWFAMTYDEEQKMAVATPMLRNSLYRIAYQFSLSLSVMFVIPWSLIVVLNFTVFFTIQRSKELFRKQSKTHKMQSRRRTEYRRTIRAMLVALTFVLFNMPNAVFNVVGLLHMNWLTKDYLWIDIMHNTATLLICINSATNWIIYCATGAEFRRQYRGVFLFSNEPIDQRTSGNLSRSRSNVSVPSMASFRRPARKTVPSDSSSDSPCHTTLRRQRTSKRNLFLTVPMRQTSRNAKSTTQSSDSSNAPITEGRPSNRRKRKQQKQTGRHCSGPFEDHPFKPPGYRQSYRSQKQLHPRKRTSDNLPKCENIISTSQTGNQHVQMADPVKYEQDADSSEISIHEMVIYMC